MAWISTIPGRGSPLIALRRRPAYQVKRAAPGLSCDEVDLTTTAGPACFPAKLPLLVDCLADTSRRGGAELSTAAYRLGVTGQAGIGPEILIPHPDCSNRSGPF